MNILGGKSIHYCDLHTHLYGCIDSKTLLQIGKNNPSPRWEIFTKLHEEIYREKINSNEFFQRYGESSEFEKLYHFKGRAPFLEFQSKFNLVIALCRFDEEEIRLVCEDVMRRHLTDGVSEIEYRIMYSPFESKEGYHARTKAACEGLRIAEKKLDEKIKGRLVVSVHRDGEFETQYEWLKEFMRTDETIRKYLVGIDFCSIEENYPPKNKKDFFRRVLIDNKNDPSLGLSILYHVGESFSDKSPNSAVRWILESSLNGAHRLGHCLALGLRPEFFRGKFWKEKVSERTDQLEFEIEHFEEIRSFGKIQPVEKKKAELEILSRLEPDEMIVIHYDSNFELDLWAFQEFAMKKIQENRTVIESCPTSNLRIGMIDGEKFHPIKRFVDSGLCLTIGTDDPGIFDTNIQEEYATSARSGISETNLEDIRKNSSQYVSEKLSGRKG